MGRMGKRQKRTNKRRSQGEGQTHTKFEGANDQGNEESTGEWKIPASEIDRVKAYWKQLSKYDKLEMLDVDAEGVVKRLVEKIAAHRDIEISEIPPEILAPFVTAISSPEVRVALCMEFLHAVESDDGRTKVPENDVLYTCILDVLLQRLRDGDIRFRTKENLCVAVLLWWFSSFLPVWMHGAVIVMTGIVMGVYIQRTTTNLVESQLHALVSATDGYLRRMGAAQHTFDRVDALISGMFLVGTSYWSTFHLLLVYMALLSLIASDLSHRMPGKGLGESVATVAWMLRIVVKLCAVYFAWYSWLLFLPLTCLMMPFLATVLHLATTTVITVTVAACLSARNYFGLFTWIPPGVLSDTLYSVTSLLLVYISWNRSWLVFTPLLILIVLFMPTVPFAILISGSTIVQPVFEFLFYPGRALVGAAAVFLIAQAMCTATILYVFRLCSKSMPSTSNS